MQRAISSFSDAFDRLLNLRRSDSRNRIIRINCLYINFFIFERNKKRQRKNLHSSSILSNVAVSNGERSVWTFTLRDSKEDFINVTVWGSTEFVKKLSNTFTIGSVGEYFKNKSPVNYKELTPSPYNIT